MVKLTFAALGQPSCFSNLFRLRTVLSSCEHSFAVRCGIVLGQSAVRESLSQETFQILVN